VAKLFNIVQPDVAYFGAKDFQQAAIIRRMAEDLNFPLAIEVCPTVREPDGLAMSSRNAYLTPDQRREAPALWQSLSMAAEMVADRRPPARQVVQAILAYLADCAPGGIVDYVEIVNPVELSPVERTDGKVLIALAVRFGRARLIDNILVD
jgi:pantoate--beta-alanine ligase